MKKEPNSKLSPTLGIIKVFSDNFSRLLRLLTVLQRQRRKAKTGTVSLLLCLLKKLLYCLSQQAPVFEHRKSRAIKRPAITVLLWCYLGIFTPKKSFAKNNTNSVFISEFVFFICVSLGQNLVFKALFGSVSDDKYFLSVIFKGLLDDKYFF